MGIRRFFQYKLQFVWFKIYRRDNLFASESLCRQFMQSHIERKLLIIWEVSLMDVYAAQSETNK